MERTLRRVVAEVRGPADEAGGVVAGPVRRHVIHDQRVADPTRYGDGTAAIVLHPRVEGGRQCGEHDDHHLLTALAMIVHAATETQLA